MNISITGNPGNYWINRERKDHGPFKTILDASYTAVMMVTDDIQASYVTSPAVQFVYPRMA